MHFKCAISPMAQRLRFYNAVKNKDETVQQWAAWVRSLATKCEFGPELNVVLRDKFIMGLDQPRIIGKIFYEKVTLLWEKAIQIASSQMEKPAIGNVQFKKEIFYHQSDKNRRSNSQGLGYNKSGGRLEPAVKGPAAACRAERILHLPMDMRRSTSSGQQMAAVLFVENKTTQG